MKKDLSHYCLLLYAFIVGLGTYDPVFDAESPVGLVEIALILLAISSLISPGFSFTQFRSTLSETKFPIIMSCIILFSTALYSIRTGTPYFFNYRLAGSIVAFFFLCQLMRKNENLIIKVLYFFSLGVCLVITFSFLGFINTEFNHTDRLVIQGENSNFTSSRTVLAILSIIALFFSDYKIYGKFKNLLLIFLPLLFYAVLYSGSRGSFLIMILSVLIIILFSWKTNLRNRVIIVLISIFFFANLSLAYNYVRNTSSFDRLVLAVESRSIGGREQIWKDAMDIGFDNFLIGVGENGYQREMVHRYGYYLDTHNMYIYVFVTGGIIAMIFLLLFYRDLIKIVYRQFARHRKILPLVICVFVTFLAFKTGGALFSKNIWFYFAVLNSFK